LFSTEIEQMTSNQQSAIRSEELAAAHAISRQAYDENFAELIKFIPGYIDDIQGFGATADWIGGTLYVGFRGTSVTSWQDWKANAMQALGFKTYQYERALQIADAAHAYSGGNVIFVGHSLGGGLASAAAHRTGGRAITFNAAGLSNRYKGNRNPLIHAEFAGGDVLSLSQDLTPLPNAAGSRSLHLSRKWWRDPFRQHFLDSLAY
jgi:pimeloyl-ACP methyl ester carboxylesterase